MNVRIAAITIGTVIVWMALFTLFFRFALHESTGAAIAASAGPTLIVAIVTFIALRKRQREKQ